MKTLALGFLLVFGAVGGMDNPDQADYFLEQISLAVIGLVMMYWGSRRLVVH